MVDLQIPKIGRRVVTGTDSKGKSTVLMDGPVPENAVGVDPGRLVNWVWRENEIPAKLGGEVDRMRSYRRGDWSYNAGVIVGVFRWDPGAEVPMHAAESVDVLFIASGNLELVLESGSTVLGPGDCVVQRGTRHGWRVVGDTPLVMVAVAVAKK